jgi:hypothetical protein
MTPHHYVQCITNIWAPAVSRHPRDALTGDLLQTLSRWEDTEAATRTITDQYRHDDIITFTVQLGTEQGEVAWAARVFIFLDETGRIREDYQLTVQRLAA